MKKPGYRIIEHDFAWAVVIGEGERYETSVYAHPCEALADARAFVRWKKGRVVRVEGR